MAYKGFVKIKDCNAVTELMKGQPSQLEKEKYPKEFTPENCFEVVSWAWDAVAPVNHATGQLTGTAVTGTLRLVKYVGTLSQHFIDAIGKNAEFVAELTLFDQEGVQATDPTGKWAILTAEKARVSSVTMMTGTQSGAVQRAKADISYFDKFMSSITNLGASGESTHPLEVVEISFRRYWFQFCGTKSDTKSEARDALKK